MKTAHHETAIWAPPGRPPQPLFAKLAEAARAGGGLTALTHWRHALEGQRVTYVHGQRHDLWWEFDLASSFQWQAQLHQMQPDKYRQRLQALTGALEIGHLLTCQVGELTPAQRALADLAVALLPRPRLLVWEEPFALLDDLSGARACELVRVLTTVEGLTAILVAEGAPGLKEEWHHARCDEARALDRRSGTHAWAAGRRTAAGGALWA
ncbi:MAG TPA: hypothetical protein VK464_19365 [Symbiobacteriaceae bacterium]|jgi:ABC-type Mn2+/Zn2+ transport system ATPase subunit|nr:hypothetical protein [Symbiobacteriaceae bacterium]